MLGGRTADKSLCRKLSSCLLSKLPPAYSCGFPNNFPCSPTQIGGSLKFSLNITEHTGEPEFVNLRARAPELLQEDLVTLCFYFFNCPFVLWCDAGAMLQTAGIRLQEIIRVPTPSRKKIKMLEGNNWLCEVNTSLYLYIQIWFVVRSEIRWWKIFLNPNRKSCTRGDNVWILWPVFSEKNL